MRAKLWCRRLGFAANCLALPLIGAGLGLASAALVSIGLNFNMMGVILFFGFGDGSVHRSLQDNLFVTRKEE